MGVGKLLLLAVNPRCHGGSHDLLECGAEGAVTAVAALRRELLGGECASVGRRFFVKVDEVADAESVDVSVIRDALLGEVLAQIGPVCADGSCQLRQGEVVLQIEQLVLAVLFQKGAYLAGSGLLLFFGRLSNFQRPIPVKSYPLPR